MTPRNLAVLICFAVIAAMFGMAQVPVGTPPFSTVAAGAINVQNLNAHLQMPVVHKAGRGVAFNYDLTYDSSVWYPAISGSSKVWTPVTSWGWGGGLQGMSLAGQITYTITNFTCGSPYPTGGGQSTNGWFYTDAYGTKHAFSGGTYVYSGQGCTGQQVTSFTSTATDGSGLTLNGNASPYLNTVVTRDGTVLTPPSNASGFSTAGVTDTNGNYAASDSTGHFTDTLGNANAMVISGASPNPVHFTYLAPGPSGTTAQVTVNYRSYTLKTNFGCSGVSEYGPTNIYLVDNIQLPDGSSYQFSYEPTPGFSGDYTGRLKSVTLPTQGQITYTYTGTNNGIVCSDGSAAGLTKATPDGSWTLTRTAGSGAAWTTVVADPNNNQTRYQFQGLYQTKKEVFQGTTGGTILETVDTCYNGNTTISTCTTTAVSLPISRQTVWTSLPNSAGRQKKSDTYYNSNGLVTDVYAYDFGSAGAGPGGQLRHTNTAYNTSLTNNIRDRVSSVSVYDGSSNPLSSTTYGYDEGGALVATSGTPQHNSITGSRGNLTSVHQTVVGTTTLNRSFTYYDTGAVNVATDVNGATTTSVLGTDTVANCGNSFPVEVDLPITGLKSTMTWDCVGGVQKQATDANNNMASTTYYDANNTPTSDPFWRPIYSTDALSNKTNFSYSITTSESKFLFNGSASIIHHLVSFDTQGRVHVSQKEQAPNYSLYDSVETDYDNLGRAYKSTLPYQGTAGQTATNPKVVTTQYDGAGRPTEIDDANTGFIKYTYLNNDVKIEVGPAATTPQTELTKKRQLEYDGLGRLTSVCELTSGYGSWPGGTCTQNGSPTGYWTKYQYGIAPNYNSLTVTQNAQSATTQSRVYVYDMVGRLTSEANPESGTTAYVYDTDGTCGTSTGDLVKKTDALGNVTCYAYDALHRLTAVTYPSGQYHGTTDERHFVYDAATVNSATMSNAKGRLAEAYTGPSGSKKTDLGFSYSARGEMLDVYQKNVHSGTYYHVTATYWEHGVLKQLNFNGITGLPTLTYGVGGEGRVNSVTGGTIDPVKSVSYDLNTGTLNSITYGATPNNVAGDTDAFTYNPNTLKMATYQFNVGSQNVNGTLTWNPNGSLQQLAIVDGLNANNTQTCKYTQDDVSRLLKVDCGTKWEQDFAFDPFSNIKKSTTGTGTAFNPNYSNSTNRITSGTTAYDANGNQTNDGIVPQTYTWDANGNPLSLSDGTTNVSVVVYDALGRVAENQVGSGYTDFLYGPGGTKLAKMNGSTLLKGFVPLPGGGSAIYTSTGLAYYRHPDWMGTSRLASSPARTLYYDTAYAPYGEDYNAATGSGGAVDLSFTGQNQDSLPGLYDFPMRRYNPVQGRWISPDPAGVAAVDMSAPQTWNRYAYVRNSPLAYVDPDGTSDSECEWCDSWANAFFAQAGRTHQTFYANLAAIHDGNTGVQVGTQYDSFIFSPFEYAIDGKHVGSWDQVADYLVSHHGIPYRVDRVGIYEPETNDLHTAYLYRVVDVQGKLVKGYDITEANDPWPDPYIYCIPAGSCDQDELNKTVDATSGYFGDMVGKLAPGGPDTSSVQYKQTFTASKGGVGKPIPLSTMVLQTVMVRNGQVILAEAHVVIP